MASEMIKFTIMGFFKRCQLYLKLLRGIEDNKRKVSNQKHPWSNTQTSEPNDAANLLTGAFWWYFTTLESSFKLATDLKIKIYLDLQQFFPVVFQIVKQLDFITSASLKSSKFFKKTVYKLNRIAFFPEESDQA